MAGADRISALPDDLLHHILTFATAREAAASSILSRRWRPLRRRKGVLNLDSRHYSSRVTTYDHNACHDVFFRDAAAALAASLRRRSGGGRGTSTLKRLTLFLEVRARRGVARAWHYDARPEGPEGVWVAGLLIHHAAAELEELRIVCERHNYHSNTMYSPPLASLPFAPTLRVLELEGCNIKPPLSSSFLCMTDLTLRHCFLREGEGHLQTMVDAAPALASLALVRLTQKVQEPLGQRLRLRCPTVTALVLETQPSWRELEDSGIDLDMPSLRFFRYKGVPIRLSLASPAPGLERVHLDATEHEHLGRKYEPTSRMLVSFSGMRALKLHLNCIEDIVAAEGAAILPMFPNLKLLQIDGKYTCSNMNTAVAVAALLRSCPAMFELRLRLDIAAEHKAEDLAAGSTFAESMDRFQRLASMSSSTHRHDAELAGVSESELPAAFTNCSFSCLETNLRKVTLQFKAKEVNCFLVRLAKFLVENAMALEEMHVDDGSQFWPDHLGLKVARWRAHSFRRRNLPDTAGLRVYSTRLRASQLGGTF